MGGFLGDVVKAATGGAVDLDKTKEEAEKAAAKAAEEAEKLVVAAKTAADAAAASLAAAAQAGAAAAVKAQMLPTIIAMAALKNDPNAVRDAVAELVRYSSDSASAVAFAVSTPYFLAADLTKNAGGDGATLLRGAIAGKLVEINILPALLKQIGRLDAKTPEEVADAVKNAPLGAVLCAFLQAAYDTLEPVAKPMPALVKAVLRDFYDKELLSKVKYVIAPLGLTLPEVINGYQVFMGNHAHAVAVGNVIAFSVEPDASDQSVFWWAHEVCHAEQYAKLGFDGFAAKYVEDYQALEKEADDRAAKVQNALTA